MPRRKIELPPPEDHEQPMELYGRALKLWTETNEQWDLDGVAANLLRCACESLQRADQASAVIDRDGLTVQDRFGQTQKHPCCILERDFRAQAAASLQKLALHLEG